MPRFLSVAFLGSLLLLSGCNSVFSRTPTMDSFEESFVDMPSVSYESSGSTVGGKSMLLDSVVYDAVQTDRQLIKTADMGLHVADVREAAMEVAVLAEGQEGDVTNSSISRGDNSYTAYITLKVPSDRFDSTLVALKALADYVEYENTNATDVTEYYTDLETRLTNKQAEEKQYLEILGRADTVEDTLAVTQALSNVRYEIESLQGQIKSYDSQIDYSAISLTLTEDESAAAVSEQWSPNSTVNEALSDFVAFVQRGVDFVIYLAIFAWPLVLALLAVWLWRKTTKRSRK